VIEEPGKLFRRMARRSGSDNPEQASRSRA
jgi:hypothetical protein